MEITYYYLKHKECSNFIKGGEVAKCRKCGEKTFVQYNSYEICCECANINKICMVCGKEIKEETEE